MSNLPSHDCTLLQRFYSVDFVLSCYSQLDILIDCSCSLGMIAGQYRRVCIFVDPQKLECLLYFSHPEQLHPFANCCSNRERMVSNCNLLTINFVRALSKGAKNRTQGEVSYLRPAVLKTVSLDVRNPVARMHLIHIKLFN